MSVSLKDQALWGWEAIERFQDLYGTKVFRAQTFRGSRHLVRASATFEALHNSHHRSSKTGPTSYTFTGNAATADGALIGTEILLFLGG